MHFSRSLILKGLANYRMSKHFFIIIISTLISCKMGKANLTRTYSTNTPTVSFCDLPRYKGQQVYLKSYYSGIDEYWSLSSTEKRKCNPELTVDLQFAGFNPFQPPVQYENVFRKVHESYHNSYLLMEAVGAFDNERRGGYGHLNSNNSRFVVSEIIKVTIIKK